MKTNKQKEKKGKERDVSALGILGEMAGFSGLIEGKGLKNF